MTLDNFPKQVHRFGDLATLSFCSALTSNPIGDRTSLCSTAFPSAWEMQEACRLNRSPKGLDGPRGL